MNRLYIVILFQLLFYNSEAQSLQSKVIPFDGNPSVANIGIIGNKFIISAVSFINDTVSTTYIYLDADLETLNKIEINGFAVNNSGVFFNSEGLFSVGNNYIEDKFITLLQTNENFDEPQVTNYLTNSDFNFSNISFLLENHIYTLTVDTYFNPERKETFVQKIDLEGQEIWSKTLGINENWTAGIDITAMENGQIVIGSIRIIDGELFTEIVNLSQTGEKNWSILGEEKTPPGYSSHRSVILSNDVILNLSTVDRRTDTEFLMNGWSNRPLKITWLDPGGVPYRDTLLITNKEEHYTLSRIKKGAGDYFFIYGARQNPNFLNGDYGWLCKMSNEGEILWNRTYHVTGLMETGHFHNIKDIEEMDNGDIVTIGTALKPGESQQIWAMRINADGCFSDGECGDISTATDDISIPRERIKIYPNPSNGLIQFDYGDIPSSDLASISVLNMSGANVHEEKGEMQDYLSLDHLPKGVYFVQFKFKTGKSILEKVILE